MKILTCLYSASNVHESMILRGMHEGARIYFNQLLGNPTDKELYKKHSIDLSLHYDIDVPKCDVAIQFGSVKPRETEYHVCRQNIQKAAQQIVYVETPFLGRVIRSDGEHAWYRVGLNGFLNGQDAFDLEIDHHHCNSVLKYLGLTSWPGWRDPSQGNILLMTQLPGDASVRAMDMAQWTLYCISRIRQLTDRAIRVRLHPALSAKGRQEFLRDLAPILIENHSNVTWSSGLDQTLNAALSDCGVCVTYSSGSAIDAIVRGIPTIAMDEASMAFPVSSHFVEDVIDPKLATRSEVEQWIQMLANNQFNEQQIRSGQVWSRFWDRIQHQCQQ